jgi:hypothetical protein
MYTNIDLSSVLILYNKIKLAVIGGGGVVFIVKLAFFGAIHFIVALRNDKIISDGICDELIVDDDDDYYNEI